MFWPPGPTETEMIPAASSYFSRVERGVGDMRGTRLRSSLNRVLPERSLRIRKGVQRVHRTSAAIHAGQNSPYPKSTDNPVSPDQSWTSRSQLRPVRGNLGSGFCTGPDSDERAASGHPSILQKLSFITPNQQIDCAGGDRRHGSCPPFANFR